MASSESKSIQAKEKSEVTTLAEQMKPGPVYTPTVDIYETENDIIVLADMPGVKSKDLNIDLKENTLTLDGDVKHQETEQEEYLIREYQTGRYFRQFSVSEQIDQAKINAELKDGVLKLTLPKTEKAAPRKIQVKG
ncbi:Hsp20/alpha crystallin family protein [Thermodesulfobacteriota bacterium]